jgi:hypothetical protein
MILQNYVTNDHIVKYDYACLYAPPFLIPWHAIFETTVQIPEVDFRGKYGYLRAKNQLWLLAIIEIYFLTLYRSTLFDIILKPVSKQNYLQVEQGQLSKRFIFAMRQFKDLFWNIKVNVNYVINIFHHSLYLDIQSSRPVHRYRKLISGAKTDIWGQKTNSDF